MNHFVEIKKKDGKEQLVYGMVYAPDLLDAQGDMMTAETVREMAHGYLRDTNIKKSIDTHHDNWSKNCYPVESYIAKAGDPDFIEGAWVLAVKVDDDTIWAQVEKGDINGFSFEGKAVRTKVLVEYDYLPTIIGYTEPAEDGHTHSFLVKMDDNGKPVFGRTSEAADGHFHDIARGTATNSANDHKHRINLKFV